MVLNLEREKLNRAKLLSGFVILSFFVAVLVGVLASWILRLEDEYKIIPTSENIAARTRVVCPGTAPSPTATITEPADMSCKNGGCGHLNVQCPNGILQCNTTSNQCECSNVDSKLDREISSLSHAQVIGDNGCQYYGPTGLRDAIHGSMTGDTVLVRAGTYTGVQINENGKNFKLIGEGNVIFDSKSASNYAITFANGGNVTIENIEITSIGGGISLSGTNATIKNVRIHDVDQKALDIKSGATVVVESSQFFNNIGDHAISAASGSTLKISKSLIYSNKAGINIVDSTIEATNNVFDNHNLEPIACRIANSTCKLTNNIFSNNFKTVTTPVCCVVDLNQASYNLFYANQAQWPPSQTELATRNNIFVDPRFQLNSLPRYQLQSTSPAIDAGDPTIYDTNGTRSDIGAYGGVQTCATNPSLPGCPTPTQTPTPTGTPIACTSSGQCPEDTICQNNVCVAQCPTGQTSCSGVCKNLQNDRWNCGACGYQCGDEQSCQSGVCTNEDTPIACQPGGVCPAGRICQNNVCVSQTPTPTETAIVCTSSGQCPEDTICQNNVCVAQCPTGQTSCSGVCKNLQNDRWNCGACGYQCGDEQSCQNGTCVNGGPLPQCITREQCPADELTQAYSCSSSGVRQVTTTGNVYSCNPQRQCVKTAINPTTSDAPCQQGYTCQGAGQCVLAQCPVGYADCDNNNTNGCEVNTQTNQNHCGACGNVCGTGKVCSSGTCVATQGDIQAPFITPVTGTKFVEKLTITIEVTDPAIEKVIYVINNQTPLEILKDSQGKIKKQFDITSSVEISAWSIKGTNRSTTTSVSYTKVNLTKPANLSYQCHESGARVQLKWDPVPGAQAYLVSVNKDGNFEPNNPASGDQFIFTPYVVVDITNITSGQNYIYFKVKPLVGLQNDPSNYDMTPDTPTYVAELSNIKCGATNSNTPVVLPYETITNQPSIQISGTKLANTSLWLDGTQITSVADSQTNWTFSLPLNKIGFNNFELYTKNQAGVESAKIPITVKRCLLGDINCDGVVNIADFSLFATAYQICRDTQRASVYSGYLILKLSNMDAQGGGCPAPGGNHNVEIRDFSMFATEYKKHN